MINIGDYVKISKPLHHQGNWGTVVAIHGDTKYGVLYHIKYEDPKSSVKSGFFTRDQFVLLGSHINEGDEEQ